MKPGDAQRWLASIVESADDAIIGKRLDGTIVSWNAAATRIYGYSESEMIGQSVLKLFPDDLADEERITVAKLVRGERVDPYESRHRRKDGTVIEVSVSSAPIMEGGAMVGAATISRDITRDKEQREAGQKHSADLEARAAHVEALEARVREAERIARELEESNAQLNRALAAARIARG